MAKQYPSVQRGFTSIDINENISFAYPFAGPNDYRSLAKKILSNKTAKMSLPNGEQTSYLLLPVYCGPEEFQNKSEAIELRFSTMMPRYLYIFQRNFWIPEKYHSAHGVFVVYDENGVGTSEELDIGELERALKGGRKLNNGIRFSEDEKIGFAPRNTYKEGEMSAEKFANDGFIIVSNKEQGARNLAEVSQSKYFRNKAPRSWIVNPDKETIQTVPAVGDDRYWGGSGLIFDGSCRGGYGGGCASGVLVSGEATRKILE